MLCWGGEVDSKGGMVFTAVRVSCVNSQAYAACKHPFRSIHPESSLAPATVNEKRMALSPRKHREWVLIYGSSSVQQKKIGRRQTADVGELQAGR